MDSIQRFTSRAEDYARYRPSYPDAVVELLQRACGLAEGAVVADVGSGTGISSELFLRHGYRVHAVEPNDAMRAQAERWLGGVPGFSSVPARAEATTLPDASVDLVVAGQAFHWFEPEATRREFARILKPGGCVALMWNSRRTDADPFTRGYEALLKTHSLDYARVTHRNIGPDELGAFFGPDGCATASFPNDQLRDYEALRGGLLSASYAPQPGHPNFEPLMAELRRLFDAHQTEGRVVVATVTEVFYGRLSGEDLRGFRNPEGLVTP
jgi:SAM-dependent methyltransferase